MGLDTSHDCWHGPYSAFNRFRTAVAAAAKAHSGYEPDYDAHPLRAFQGWWDPSNEDGGHPYSDPLDVFFIHSDCDGWIFPHDAEALVDALIPLLPLVPNDDYPDHPTFSTQSRLGQFIAGLKTAADEWELVRFS